MNVVIVDIAVRKRLVVGANGTKQKRTVSF